MVQTTLGDQSLIGSNKKYSGRYSSSNFLNQLPYGDFVPDFTLDSEFPKPPTENLNLLRYGGFTPIFSSRLDLDCSILKTDLEKVEIC